jgi:hypothetical protein
VMAADVTFAIEPPTGVTITKAELLLDDTTEQSAAASTGGAASTGASAAGASAASAASASAKAASAKAASAKAGVNRPAKAKAVTAEASTVAATCKPASQLAANAVICEAPDAAGLTGSELWLTLAIGKKATSGAHTMRVTIATTSKDGNEKDNTIQVPLLLTAADSDNDTGSLPTTGSDVARLVLMSLMIMAFGVVLLAGPRFAPAGAARRHSHARARHARHAAPWFGSSWFDSLWSGSSWRGSSWFGRSGRGISGRGSSWSSRSGRDGSWLGGSSLGGSWLGGSWLGDLVTRLGTPTRGRGGSHASTEDSGAASRATPPGGRGHRPPAHAKSAPARRRRSGE